MKIQALLKKIASIDRRRTATVAILALAVFTMLAAFWNQPCFISDEAEIFMHGQAIAHGELLYRDIGSQHMPLMYYIAALFSLLGVGSIVGFRLCFYALFALLCGLIYYVYSNRRARLGLILYPVIFILLMTDINWKASVLSDQFQGIGMAILFLEFLNFTETRKLEIKSCVMVSLAVFLSFGSAFVSIFAIFIMALSVMAFDVFELVKEKPAPKEATLSMLKKYGRLFGIVLAPFVPLILFYVISGSFDDFISWAYLLNVDIYPKYIDYGTSVFSSLFGGFKYFFEFFTAISFTAINATLILRIAVIFLAVAFISGLARTGSGSFLKTVGAILFIGACATRGLFDFHGTPVLSVLALCSALSISEFAGRIFKKGAFTAAVAALLTVVVISPYCYTVLPNLKSITNDEVVPSFESNLTAKYVDALTERGERVGFSTLDCDVMVTAGVIPASVQAGSVPWFWEQAGDKAMEQLRSAPPRVFLYDEYHGVWGHAMTIYAPELVEFITTNYVQISAAARTVWVHVTYYEEAMAIINEL